MSRRDYGPPLPPTKDKLESRLQSMYPLPSGLRASSRPAPSSDKKAKHRTEEEYFDSDEGAKSPKSELEYQPAPGSPSADRDNFRDSDNDEDPLDAYMNQVNAEADRDLKNVGKKEPPAAKRQDIEAEDDQESFFRWLEENPDAGVSLQAMDELEEDRDIDYDDDGNLIPPEKSKWIDPLPEIDHSTIDYQPFNKNFYTEHEEISGLDEKKVAELRSTIGIKISGYDPPRPVASFAHFGFDNQLMAAIRRSQFTQPTPIQSQAIPAILGGRDVIGIGKTGSGKTCAYVWPALIHIMDQPNLKEEDGPIVLVLVPTRELAQQIHSESRKFAKAYNIQVGCAYGGANLHEQIQACRNGSCEILISTPGRLIDLVKKKAVSLSRVTFLVLDEADRLLDIGFEPQVRSIADHVRPDRQCMLFSATFRPKIERLCRDLLSDPVRIMHGELGEANENITQVVEVLASPSDKWTWLTRRIVQFTSHGKVLIFVTRKENCETLAKNLSENGYPVRMIHGDVPQFQRDEVVHEFRKDLSILIATDVAARGLDIRNIKTVLNYDVARDINTHVHRIGRTARAGEKGFAFTLITAKDKEFAPHLVRNLEQNNQFVPPELLKIALSVAWFANSRKGGAKKPPKKITVGGAGLGYKERPSQNQVGPMADYRGVNLTGNHLNGPQGQRLSALKSAFQSQFKSNFVAAQSDPGLRTPSSVAVPSSASHKRYAHELDESGQKRKKSRFSD